MGGSRNYIADALSRVFSNPTVLPSLSDFIPPALDPPPGPTNVLNSTPLSDPPAKISSAATTRAMSNKAQSPVASIKADQAGLSPPTYWKTPSLESAPTTSSLSSPPSSSVYRTRAPVAPEEESSQGEIFTDSNEEYTGTTHQATAHRLTHAERPEAINDQSLH